MGNSHPCGGKTRRAEPRFHDRGFGAITLAFAPNSTQKSNSRGSFARPRLRYPSASPRVQIDILTQRSGIGLTERIAEQPVIRRDVEQWKHIPRKAESGTQAFL